MDDLIDGLMQIEYDLCDGDRKAMDCADEWQLIFDSKQSCLNAKEFGKVESGTMSLSGGEPCGYVRLQDIDRDYRRKVKNDEGRDVLQVDEPSGAAGAIVAGVLVGILLLFWIFCCVCVSTKGFKKGCKVKRCWKCCCHCRCKCC